MGMRSIKGSFFGVFEQLAFLVIQTFKQYYWSLSYTEFSQNCYRITDLEN